MGRAVSAVDQELETRVEALGFELVQVEWAGSKRRPLLRIRVDRKDASPTDGVGGGVTVDDCAEVSRGLEAWLDEHPEMPERYVLEVSSPGLERPLVRSRDYRRFVGSKVAVKGPEVLAGRATRLEGELLGLEAEGENEEAVRLRLPGGDEVSIPRREITGAHLVFEWE